MTTVNVHHNDKLLPRASANLIPVQVYGRSGIDRGDIAVLGNPLKEKIRRLGIVFQNVEMDFLTIALAVTAADTFVKREEAADGWVREITLKIPLCEPEPWLKVKSKLENTLAFLSGDLWKIEITDGGFPPPIPYERDGRFKLAKLKGLDCVSLFSGGLDSAIGAINLLEAGRKPLLISHGYRGDQTHQKNVSRYLDGNYSTLCMNADPHASKARNVTDISMRTRSINFLAFAVMGSYAIKIENQLERVQLFVPENGFISLNAPLTPRRIGSLSTRTTHPHFLSEIQYIFDEVGIAATIINPYQFHTKGEMVKECRNQDLLKTILKHTVSCSHWKR